MTDSGMVAKLLDALAAGDDQTDFGAASKAIARTASRTALDLDMRQVAALAAVWSVVARWDIGHQPGKRLGDIMKVLPPDHVEAIEQALIAGGLANRTEDGPSPRP
jgi:hypothetical protein